MYISMELADAMAPGTNCGVSGVLKQATVVPPNATTLFTNRTVPDPFFNDDASGGSANSGDIDCQDVLVFGGHPFEDGTVGCDAAVWLASSHPWWCWVLVYGSCFILASCVCATVRYCCAKLWRCIFCNFCCCRGGSSRRRPRNKHRLQFAVGGVAGLQEPLVVVENGHVIFLDDEQHEQYARVLITE